MAKFFQEGCYVAIGKWDDAPCHILTFCKYLGSMGAESEHSPHTGRVGNIWPIDHIRPT